MSDKPASGQKDPDIQYIATRDVVRTLLADSDDVPKDILQVMDQNYDFLADPGTEDAAYEGTGRQPERRFLWEYRANKGQIKSDAKRLAGGNEQARSQGRRIPFYLIAMALRRSPQGKRRVILTDDPGLTEQLQYHGIETMGSSDFVQKMRQDKVIPDFDRPRERDAAKRGRDHEHDREKEAGERSRDKQELRREDAGRERGLARPYDPVKGELDRDEPDRDEPEHDEPEEERDQEDLRRSRTSGFFDIEL